MSHAVIFHDEGTDDSNLVVFDLSKREVLTADILKKAIEKLSLDGLKKLGINTRKIIKKCVCTQKK